MDRIEVHDIPDPVQPGRADPDRAPREFAQLQGLLVANGGLRPLTVGIDVGRAPGGRSRGRRRGGVPAGDHVVSCFFPQWQMGYPVDQCQPRQHAGDGIDGFAAPLFGTAATAFTHAPRVEPREAATITTALSLRRTLVGDGQIKPAIPS